MQTLTKGKSFAPSGRRTSKTLLSIGRSTTAVCLLLNSKLKANQKKSIIKGWRYRSRKLLKAIHFLSLKQKKSKIFLAQDGIFFTPQFKCALCFSTPYFKISIPYSVNQYSNSLFRIQCHIQTKFWDIDF